ncbi:DUF2809 domain-containing protein [Leptolyngbyaceae cyanobacterium CCMR0082]|uniref:DUF2809 domain-containing protein n=2 Tax=Adonisia turfae TaxID=2950184 RepID=A0A6M0SIB2_9CYAN|nr:DUF2809 domain-containing protein [Adonisia turfae]NEZ55812.1 DUF2809 domain-containing protein [Adonisia turfae CCMR0081]NEZ68066.1 DUF2809 domain-containing protein [Adonisia turfae CCMR0082]
MRFNLYYFYWFALLLITEIYIGIFIKDDFIRPYMGDFLVVILIYAFVRAFFKYSINLTAIGVLLFSFLVEILQHFNIVDVLGLGSSRLARTVIGTSFSWEDFIAYSLGIIIVLVSEKFIGPSLKKESPSST